MNFKWMDFPITCMYMYNQLLSYRLLLWIFARSASMWSICGLFVSMVIKINYYLLIGGGIHILMWGKVEEHSVEINKDLKIIY